jgi:N-acetylmuramic acid 6-phosphate etherase
MPAAKWRSLATEKPNARSRAVDQRPSVAIVDLMADEDERVLAAIRRERRRIAQAADLLADALGTGGRVLLTGAGTSGRLAVIEAAEMPPTFGTAPCSVQAVMAGGRQAVFRACEGAEDDRRQGRDAVARLRPSSRDVVVGISASGVTPFVHGALRAARGAGACTIGITCGAVDPLNRVSDLVITLRVGPEVIAGSTRLKAGTATKIVLNMLTTIAMIRVGKTYGHLMVDVQATNAKLRDRARRMVATVGRVDARRAGRLLRQAGWQVKTAIVMARTGVNAPDATRRLAEVHGSLGAALRT